MSLIFSRWRQRLLCLACLACTNPAAWAQQDGPGLQRLYISAPARERPLEVLLWYPAAPGGRGGPLAQALPDARYDIVTDAIHFSFLGECQPNGPAVLAGEGDTDPLCDDGGSRTRASIYAELLQLVSQALVKP